MTRLAALMAVSLVTLAGACKGSDGVDGTVGRIRDGRGEGLGVSPCRGAKDDRQRAHEHERITDTARERKHE